MLVTPLNTPNYTALAPHNIYHIDRGSEPPPPPPSSTVVMYAYVRTYWFLLVRTGSCSRRSVHEHNFHPTNPSPPSIMYTPTSPVSIHKLTFGRLKTHHHRILHTSNTQPIPVTKHTYMIRTTHLNKASSAKLQSAGDQSPAAQTCRAHPESVCYQHKN